MLTINQKRLAIMEYINSVPEYKRRFDFSHNRQLYTLEFYLKCILYALKNSCNWRDIFGPVMPENIKKPNWNSVYQTFKYFSDNDIFKKAYIYYLKKYSKKKGISKYILTDTTVIINKYGVNNVSKSKEYKCKKVTKISFITDVDGMPFSVLLKPAKNDAKILVEQLQQEMMIDIKLNSKCLLADAGYYCKQVKDELTKLNCEYIIRPNNRNTKDKNKQAKLTDAEYKIYKKRVKIENAFSVLKSARRLNIRYEKFSRSFEAFIYLQLILIILDKI